MASERRPRAGRLIVLLASAGAISATGFEEYLRLVNSAG